MATADQIQADLIRLKAEHDGLKASHDQLVQQINDNVPSGLINDLVIIKTNQSTMETKITELTTAAANAFKRADEAINQTATESKAADEEMKKVIAQINSEVNNRTVALDNQGIQVADQIITLRTTQRVCSEISCGLRCKVEQST